MLGLTFSIPTFQFSDSHFLDLGFLTFDFVALGKARS